MADPEYFTLAELRALPQMENAVKYTEARCLASAAYVTSVIEGCVQTSFVARTVTGEVHDGGCYELFLKKPWILSVTSATESGVTVTDTLRVKGQRVLRYANASTFTPRPWLAGFDNVAITYQAGFSATPPADIKEAALKATRAHLLATNSNAANVDRPASITNENGTWTFSVADLDRPFGNPDVDQVIARRRRELRQVPS